MGLDQRKQYMVIKNSVTSRLPQLQRGKTKSYPSQKIHVYTEGGENYPQKGREKMSR